MARRRGGRGVPPSAEDMRIVSSLIRSDEREKIKELRSEGLLTKVQANLAHKINDNSVSPRSRTVLMNNPHVFRECLHAALTEGDLRKLGITPEMGKLNAGFPIENLLERNFYDFVGDEEFWERMDKEGWRRYSETRRETWLNAPDESPRGDREPAPDVDLPKPSILEALTERVSNFLYPPHMFAPDPSDPDYEAKLPVFEMWQEVKDPAFRQRVSKERLDLLETMLDKGFAYRSLVEASLDDDLYLKERIVSVLTPDNRARIGLDPNRKFSIQVGFPAEKFLARCLKSMSDADARILLDDLDASIARSPNPRAPAFEFAQIVRDPAFRERVPEHRLEMLDEMVKARGGHPDILDAVLDDSGYLNERIIEVLLPKIDPDPFEIQEDDRFDSWWDRWEEGVFGWPFIREDLEADSGAEKEMARFLKMKNEDSRSWDVQLLAEWLHEAIVKTPNPHKVAEIRPGREPESAESALAM